ncbi:MAG: hypothetical protein HY787_24405 [Deltaproteobacteria bacterium]|nr:hypothetical protein [Deltaproteobacteria bacterium]
MKTYAPSQCTGTIKDPKASKFISIVEAEYNKASLSEKEAQLVNDDPGLADLIANFIAENRVGKFKGLEVEPNYDYPKEYIGPMPIEYQIKVLAEVLNLDPSRAFEFAKKLPPLESFVPEEALKWTGWFATAAPRALNAFPKVTNPAEEYIRAVQFIHKEIAVSRPFYNYSEGRLIPGQFRLHSRTALALNLITKTQKGDILIVAGQLGMCHRGRSVSQVRANFRANEFGFGSLIVGSIVLTHPERLVRREELDIDCPGDEFAPDLDDNFSETPFFNFNFQKVEFGTDVSIPDPRYGSASGFLPQY